MYLFSWKFVLDSLWSCAEISVRVIHMLKILNSIAVPFELFKYNFALIQHRLYYKQMVLWTAKKDFYLLNLICSCLQEKWKLATKTVGQHWIIPLTPSMPKLEASSTKSLNISINWWDLCPSLDSKSTKIQFYFFVYWVTQDLFTFKTSKSSSTKGRGRTTQRSPRKQQRTGDCLHLKEPLKEPTPKAGIRHW